MSKQPDNVTSIIKGKEESTFCGFDGSTINKAIASMGSVLSLDEAFREMGLVNFYVKAITVFSDQVTSVCMKTGTPLFDVEKGKLIRDHLEKNFKALIEIMDEELKDHS